METKKSVVTGIAENTKQWTGGQNGTVHYHTITFANGDSGSYGSKTPKCEKFTIGVEADYTKETKVVGEYTNVIIKPVQQNTFQGGGEKKPFNQKIIVAQSSYERAVQLMVGTKSAYDLDELDKTALHIFTKVCALGGLQ